LVSGIGNSVTTVTFGDKDKQVAISGHKQLTVIELTLIRTGACRGYAVEHT
jgi:hypothetical protein